MKDGVNALDGVKVDVLKMTFEGEKGFEFVKFDENVNDIVGEKKFDFENWEEKVKLFEHINCDVCPKIFEEENSIECVK